MSHWQFVPRRLFLLVMLVLFSPVYAQTTESGADTSEPLTLVWQTEFTQDAAIITPSDLVVDHEGNVYVSTQANQNIKKFDHDGNFVTQWGGRGGTDGKFSLSSGIAVDSEGNVYVADFFNIRIQKFDPEGNFLMAWRTASPAGPASIAIDEWGNAYVDNFLIHDHYIQKFDPEGQLITEWGTRGTEDGQFGAGGQSGPEDITLDANGNVYVVDRLNHRIQKFDPDGNFLTKFGGERSEDGLGLFGDPTGIAIDGDGNMYVADKYFLQKLDPEGNFIAQWSNVGGELDGAGIVALDDEANIYVFAKADVVGATGTEVRMFVIKKFQQPW